VTRDVDDSNMIEPSESADSDGVVTPDLVVDDWLADNTVIATRDEESAESDGDPALSESAEFAAAEDAPLPVEPDRVSAWLLRVSLALIIAVLATAAAMVVFFVTVEKAPRTAVERDIAAAEIAVRERSSDPAAWQALAYAYARAQRFDDAVEVSQRGRSSTGAQILLLSEADALRAAGQYKSSLAVYDEAVTALSEEESAAVAARKKQGIATPTSNNSLVSAFYGRALARRETGDISGAIADVTIALEFAPRQSEILVTLGELQEKSGATAKAEAAYREALRFIPDDAAALAGLKRLEKRP
jgi:tetratricopeptide (TPR) repeat protein